MESSANRQKKIFIYTDGASQGNPGPAGVGIVMRYGDHYKLISEYIGEATSNFAELMAVKLALERIKDRSVPVRICVDSDYVCGVLAKGWKARANVELVFEIKQLLKKFRQVEFINLRGHSGIEDNETADSLAYQAIRRRRSAELQG
jgi:ribonuclease HI